MYATSHNCALIWASVKGIDVKVDIINYFADSAFISHFLMLLNIQVHALVASIIVAWIMFSWIQDNWFHWRNFERHTVLFWQSIACDATIQKRASTISWYCQNWCISIDYIWCWTFAEALWYAYHKHLCFLATYNYCIL